MAAIVASNVGDALVFVCQGKVYEQPQRNGKRIEDEQDLGASVQGQSKGDLGNPKQGDGATEPLMKLEAFSMVGMSV